MTLQTWEGKIEKLNNYGSGIRLTSLQFGKEHLAFSAILTKVESANAREETIDMVRLYSKYYHELSALFSLFVQSPPAIFNLD